REELAKASMPADDEHCVIHAMFPQELKKYYDSKKQPAAPAAASVVAASAPATAAATLPASQAPLPPGAKQLNLQINGKAYSVQVAEVQE
ncbi:hypothetical protein RZS08_01785, partial [Arthrospira platensis SPKY1]|nr:hypothetical protein [Arthrospira platensis SPKY1]